MKVFPFFVAFGNTFDPSEFLLADSGVEQDYQSEHVKTLQQFLENDLRDTEIEIDIEPVVLTVMPQVDPVTPEIDPDAVVVDLVTETSTNKNTTEADIALANALLVDMMVSSDDVKEEELQQYPTDPLLKDLLQHAESKVIEGSGNIESTTVVPTTEPTTQETEPTTTYNYNTTNSTQTTTDSTTESQTEEELSTLINFVESTTMGSGDFLVELESVTNGYEETTTQTTMPDRQMDHIIRENHLRAESTNEPENVEIVCRAQSMCVSLSSAFMNDLWPNARVDDLHFEELCDDYSLSVSKISFVTYNIT